MAGTQRRPDSLAWQVFRSRDALGDGLLTRAQLRGQDWSRLRYGVYADSRLDLDHTMACRAVALRLPRGAVIAGRSAALLHGVEHAASFADDVHAILPPSKRLNSQRGLRVHRTALDSGEIEDLGWCARTSAVRTAWDVAAWHDLANAVAIIDTLLRDNAVDAPGLDTMLSRAAGRRGSRKARLAFGLADGRAQSPPESILRVRLIIAGLPPPVPQCEVTVASGRTLFLDLGWPEFQVAVEVAVEYDGQVQATADQSHLDRRWLNQLVAAGWVVLHVTGERLRRDFPGLLCEIHTAITGRGWHPGMTLSGAQ